MRRPKEQVARILHNSDAKTIAGNFVWLMLLQIAGYVFPLVTMPYLARVIGPSGYGAIAFAAAIMIWIQTIADWGFNYTATRDVAKNRDDIEKISRIFSNVLWARCLLMLFSFIILIGLIGLIPQFRENAAVILVTFLMIPGHILFPDWFFQAVEKMKYITILNLLLKLLFTIAVFVFIKEQDDYILQPLFISLGYVICGIIALYIIVIRWKIRIYKPAVHAVYTTIRNSTDVFINNLAPNLYNSFSIMLLGIVGGNTANGILYGGNKFVNTFSQLQLVLSRTFFPFLSRRIDQHHKFAVVNLSVAVLLGILLFITAPWIIRIMLSPEFSDSVTVLRIMAVSLVFLALSNTYGTNYLIIKHREKTLRNITLVSSLIGIAIAFPLIYHYSYIGAALTITVSRMILGTTIWYVARKETRRPVKTHESNF